MQRLSDKIVSYASIIEDQALAQLFQTAELPIISPYVVVMPDVHFGLGSTVGSVIPTIGAVVPAAVGVDIGCGMSAVRLNLTREQLGDLKALRLEIERTIPRGEGKRGGNDQLHYANQAIERLGDRIPSGMDPDGYSQYWREQVGTLGGGNHFLEIDEDEEGYIWLTLHSGSRGVGNRCALVHIKNAQAQNQSVPTKDLAYLEEGTNEFDQYIQELNWCQDYAAESRFVMMGKMLLAVKQVTGVTAPAMDQLDCHHNYTTRETHDGVDMWVTRKGAIRAGIGDRGLIPGSMGTHSFIVEGLGNEEALESAPHGAGRVMSRRKAKEKISLETLEQQMIGVEADIRQGLLDEAPDAYKDIDRVIEDASSLVRVTHTLRPLMNIKG